MFIYPIKFSKLGFAITQQKTDTLLKQFAIDADESIANDFHQGFFSLEQKFQKLIFESNLLSSIAARELNAIANDPKYESPTWDANHILLYNSKYWQLHIGVYQHSSEFIYTLPRHMMVAITGKNHLTADHYTLPPQINNDIFDPNIFLHNPTRKIYEPGEVINIDSQKNIFDVIIRDPVIVVKFSTISYQALQWAFDRSTLQATQAIAADPVDSELVSMTQALAAMSRPVAIPSLIDLTKHPRHFVRWSAIQALGQVAPELLIKHLEKAINDPHIHIRNAASNALKKISVASK